MRHVSLILAVLTVLSFMPLAHGQGLGTNPSPEMKEVYAHYNEGAQLYFLSNVKLDTGHVEGGFGSQSASNAALSWTIALAPKLERDLVLDPDGNVEMIAYLGGAGQGRAGLISATASLAIGTTTIASGSAISNVAYVQEYKEFKWSMKPAITTIPANGEDLVWTITVSGPRNGVFLNMDETPAWSRIVLPIVALGEAPSSDPVFALTAAPVTATASPGAAASYALTLAHTSGGNGSVNLTATGLPEGVSASFDPATIFLDLGQNATVTLEVTPPAGAEPGTIPFRVEAASGDSRANVSLELVVSSEPHPTGSGGVPTESPDPSGSDHPGETANATDEAGNGTGSAQGGDGGGVPGPGAAGVLLALAILALIARRRRTGAP